MCSVLFFVLSFCTIARGVDKTSSLLVYPFPLVLSNFSQHYLHRERYHLELVESIGCKSKKTPERGSLFHR